MYLHHSPSSSLQEEPQPLSFGEGGVCSVSHLLLTSLHERVYDRDIKIRFTPVHEACLWSVHYCRPHMSLTAQHCSTGLERG